MADRGVTGPDVVVGEFGRLQVWVNGVEAPIRGERSSAVLALLMLRGRNGAPMDHIVDLVWPDSPPTARRSLANVVRRLREILGRDAILTDGSAYRIADHVGSHRRSLFEAAERAAAPSCEASETLHLAELFTEQWRGEPWLGFDELSPLVGDRMLVRDARLRLLESAAAAAVSVGDTDAARTYLRVLVSERPHHERWWCELAEIVADAGDRVAALRLLQTARSSLDQVGLLPSADLVALERELLGTADEPKPLASAPQVDRRGSPTLAVAQDLPFVGRRGEVEALVDESTGLPAAGVSFIEGPAGAGKSRLLIEAARQCNSHVVLSGRCDEAARSLLGPIQQVLEEYLASTPIADVQADAAGFEAVLSRYVLGFASGAEPPAMVPSLVEERERLVHACVSLLLRAGDRHPHLLLIDDLQWASDVVLDIVDGLVYRSDPKRLAVMGTCRFDRLTNHAQSRVTVMLAGPSRVHLTLGPLTEVDLGAIVASTASVLDVDELFQRTGGNAFFVAELVRGGPGAVDGLTLSRLVRARVDLLHSKAIEFLTTAALCGLDFDPQLVAEALAVDPATADEIVDVLIGNQLLLRDGGAHRCAFAHGLVAEAMVTTAATHKKRSLHLKIADLQQRAGVPAHIWVEHLLAAAPLVDTHTLVTASVEATRQLIVEPRPEIAESIMRRVLDLRLDPSDRVTAMTALGEALMAIGGREPASVLLAATELALQEGLDREFVKATLAYTIGGPWASNNDTNGPRLLALALARCPDDADDLRVRLEARLASYDIFTGPVDDRVRATQRAVAVARESGDATMLGDALNAGIVAVSCPARLADTRQLEDEMERLEDAGLARSEMMNRPAISTYWMGDGEKFRAGIAQRRAVITGATQRDRQALDGLEVVLSILDGDIERARTQLSELTVVTDVARGNHAWNSVTLSWLDGDVSAALPVVKDAYDDFRGGPLRYTLLWLAIEAGHGSLIDEFYDTINGRRIERLPELMLGGFALGGLAMTAALKKDRDLVELVAPVLAGLSGQMIGVPWSSYPAADFFLAVMAEAIGELELAQQHATEARRVHERMGAPAFDGLLDRYLTPRG